MTDLRLYQIDGIQEIELAIDAPWRSPLDHRPAPSKPEPVLYVLPTGAGKTVVASTIIERAAVCGWRVLVLTHRREILKQLRKPRQAVAAAPQNAAATVEPAGTGSPPQ
jgi:type I site-specific restriction endonuclease